MRKFFKNITAETGFFGCRETTTTKPELFLRLKLLPNRRLPIGQKFFPLRTLRLCGANLLSAMICANLRESAVNKSFIFA